MEITGKQAEMGQMSEKPKKFKVRKRKYIKIRDQLVDVMFAVGIFGKISEY